MDTATGVSPLQRYTRQNRYQVHKVFACATILSQDEAAIKEISIYTPSFSVTQEALDWQADQDVDTDDGDIYNHLNQMSDAPSSPHNLYSVTADRHTANATSPTFEARAGGKPASTFHHQSFRLITLEVYNGDCEYPGYHVGATAVENLDGTTVRKVPDEWWESYLDDESPELIWRTPGEQSAVLWEVQVDVLDLWVGRTPSAARRRRRRYGAFLQVYPPGGEEPESREDIPVCELAKQSSKRFKGVRYRADRRTIVAEMRVPKRKSKVSFGDFKSCEEGARAIDAGFFHYSVEDRVNFTDTRDILLTRPKLEGLNEANKLRFVKEQARWLASLAPTLPSSPSSATPEASSTTLPLPTQGGKTTAELPRLEFDPPCSHMQSSSHQLATAVLSTPAMSNPRCYSRVEYLPMPWSSLALCQQAGWRILWS